MNIFQNGFRRIDDSSAKGERITQWIAFDAHPQNQNWHWKFAFIGFVFVCGALLFWLNRSPQTESSVWTSMGVGNIIMVCAIAFALFSYFWVHKKGTQSYTVDVFESGLLIGDFLLPVSCIKSYWCLYTDDVALLYVLVEKENDTKIMPVQINMGNETPDFFEELFAQLGVPREESPSEPILDFCIRKLKL